MTDIVAYDRQEIEVLKLAASLEKYSEHHLAKPIIERAKSENLELLEVKNFEALSGKGVKGNLGAIGNRTLMEDLGISLAGIENDIIKLENEGKTVVILALEGKPAGLLAVADTLKDESIESVKTLKKEGLEVWMITGDNERVARVIALKAGIQKEKVCA